MVNVLQPLLRHGTRLYLPMFRIAVVWAAMAADTLLGKAL